MKKEYIFFDFNGTILDDLDLCLEAINRLLINKNYLSLSKQRYLDIFTFPVSVYYQEAGFSFPKDNFEELSHQFMDYYQPNSLHCKLCDSVIEVLEVLTNFGCHLILLTASDKEHVMEQLEHFDLIKYFDAILANDNIFATGKLEIAKEYLTLNKIDVASSLLVGDTIHDYEVASALNIDCVLIASGHQSKKRLEQNGRRVIDNMKEIINYLD